MTATASSIGAASTINPAEEEAASLSLLAARVASTAARASRGASLTRQDESVLRAMSSRLRSEADAVTNVGENRSRSNEPANAVAAGLTIDSYLEAKADRELSDKEIVRILVHVASMLDDIASAKASSESSNVAELFRRISSTARRMAGATGERLVGRDAEFA